MGTKGRKDIDKMGMKGEEKRIQIKIGIKGENDIDKNGN